MRNVLLTMLGLASAILFVSSIDYNEQKGYVAQGYDVVAYFDSTAIEGQDKFTHVHENAKYKFSNKENLETFKANPTKYVPQYGGWCAYAMAINGDKVSINPETFEIRNGKLYLFYNKAFTNTLKSWLEENPEELVKKANKNWKKSPQ